MAELVRSLQVLLGQVPVGTLRMDEHARTRFRLSAAYRDMSRRPVLGQLFLDDLDAEHAARSRLPAWFANLLPEGALRELLVRRLGPAAAHEFLLLQRLADDLPGAVRLAADVEDPGVPDSALAALSGYPAVALDGEPEPLRFSLAGVQLKFSATRSGRGLTIAASGRGGDWIVKFPDARFAGVPENEFATMNWARASGIDVPETALVPLKDVEGQPAGGLPDRDALAFAVRRFDRGSDGARVHIEDFAQVMGLFPEEKYTRANFETLGRLLLTIAGPEDFEAWLRRIVFMIASGNGDAHLKNWSLVYPDGMTARLAPAYDLVATVLFIPADRLALNLGKSKDWAAIDRPVFGRLAVKLGLPEGQVLQAVDEALSRTLNAWRAGASGFGFSAQDRDRLEAHMRRVPLLRPHLPDCA